MSYIGGNKKHNFIESDKVKTKSVHDLLSIDFFPLDYDVLLPHIYKTKLLADNSYSMNYIDELYIQPSI